MKENNPYLEYLISDLEFFILNRRKKVDEYLKDKEVLDYKDSVYVFKFIVEGFSKTTNLLEHLKETKNSNLIRDVCILSSEVLSWTLFAIPSLEKNLEILTFGFKIGNKHMIDIIGENLIILDELIEKPEKLSFFYPDILSSIQDINMSFGYMQKMIDSSTKEN